VITVILLVLIAIGLVVAYPFWSTARYYRNLFSVKHYREVALVLENLRNQAMLHPLVDGEVVFMEDDDPRKALTSRNLALAYTIRQEDGLYVHHLSVATVLRGGIPDSAAKIIVSFFAWRLGLKPAECTAFMGVNVFHLEFTISEENQVDFMGRSLILPKGIDLDTIRKEVLRIRSQIEVFDAKQQIEAGLAQVETGEL